MDHEWLLVSCVEKAPLIVAVEELVGWPKLWDVTLDYEVQHTRGLQSLSRLMSHHGIGGVADLVFSVMLPPWRPQ